MHPLELQLQDQKQIIEAKKLRISNLEACLRDIESGLEEVKQFLHPSRSKYVDDLLDKVSIVQAHGTTHG